VRTADAILTFARYRAITGDTTTAQATAEVAIADATELIEGYLRRPLESAERTETRRSTRTGALPSATPITAAPDGYSIDGRA
jgi:hypothetical protein